MDKILITGSTGDIGKCLRDRLVREGYDSLSLVRRKTGNGKEIIGDLKNYESLIKATKKVDIIVHLAAIIRGSKKELRETNVIGTRNLVRACKCNGVGKIVFMSSLDVMVDTEYGRSKLIAEREVIKSGLDFLILRPALVYGKNFGKGIPKLIKLIKTLPAILVIGDGKNYYQPLAVEDLIEIILKIIDKNEFNNEIYFIGGEEIISLNDLIDLISSNLNKKTYKIKTPFLKKINQNDALKSLVSDKICDNEKINKDFSFHPGGISQYLNSLIKEIVRRKVFK